jgi:hypothetical protein
VLGLTSRTAVEEVELQGNGKWLPVGQRLWEGTFTALTDIPDQAGSLYKEIRTDIPGGVTLEVGK